MIDSFSFVTAECEAHKYAQKISIKKFPDTKRERLYNEIYEAYLEGYKLSQQLNSK